MRRVAQITPGETVDIPHDCCASNYWEAGDFSSPPPCALDLGGKRSSLRKTGQADITSTLRVLFRDKLPIGCAKIGAPQEFPGLWKNFLVPPSKDCLVTPTFYIAPDERGQGNGKFLLTKLIREAHRRKAEALEAIVYRSPETLPLADFYLAQGFQVVCGGANVTRLRLDLRTLAAIPESVQSLIDRLREQVRRPATLPH